MTTYYVSTTGNNANAGTTTAGAWASIARAGSAGSVVTAGDTVIVLTGTYTVAPFTTAKAGAAGNPVTYKSVAANAAKLTTTDHGDSALIWTNNGANVTIDGFEMYGPCRLAFYNTAANGIVRYCYVHDITCAPASGGGSAVSTGNGGAAIDNIGANWIVHHNLCVRVNQGHNAVPVQVQGIYTAGNGGEVYNNIVGDISGYCIHQWHGANSQDIYNNTVFNGGTGGIIIGAGDSGLLPGGSTNNRVYNNISVNNGAYGIRELGSVSANTYHNNLLFGNTQNLAIIAASSTQSGNRTQSPSFVLYVSDGSGDYHLSGNSAAIGFADSTLVPATDFADVARPQGGTYDIGAYEFFTGGGGGGGGGTPGPDPSPGVELWPQARRLLREL